MEKVLAMKEETDQRLVDLFRNTVKKGTLRQLGGLRGGFIQRFRGAIEDGDLKSVIELEAKESVEIEFEITDEAIAKAQEDVAPGGYWSAESTSDRFLEFAIALSGDDPSKANMLLDAVKEGYKLAEEIWGGGELPELSQNTLQMTIDKFEAWRDGVESLPSEGQVETVTDEVH